jgi:hypothetical protein
MEAAVGTFIGIFVGGLITWFVSRHFYMQASEELKGEAAKLRKATAQVTHVLLRAQLNRDAQIEPNLDAEGNIEGITVGSRGDAKQHPSS